MGVSVAYFEHRNSHCAVELMLHARKLGQQAAVGGFRNQTRHLLINELLLKPLMYARIYHSTHGCWPCHAVRLAVTAACLTSNGTSGEISHIPRRRRLAVRKQISLSTYHELESETLICRFYLEPCPPGQPRGGRMEDWVFV